MKLRNKKTGEIKEFALFDGIGLQGGATLESLTKEWEDYHEEPEIGFIIDPMEEDYISADDSGYTGSDVERAKELGIWFETEEETERAVEKLKAYKRLKDLGTELLGWEIRDLPTGGNWQTINVKFNVKAKNEPMELLDLLFGEEEE
jgi:hypothetical protein